MVLPDTCTGNEKTEASQQLEAEGNVELLGIYRLL